MGILPDAGPLEDAEREDLSTLVEVIGDKVRVATAASVATWFVARRCAVCVTRTEVVFPCGWFPCLYV